LSQSTGAPYGNAAATKKSAERLSGPDKETTGEIMPTYLLVLTACVDPSKGTYPLKRADPETRLSDYHTSLRYWLRHEDPRLKNILLIENSGYSLRSLEKIAREENQLAKEVEFLSLDCNWYPKGGHYGYAELKMLDLGLQASKLRPLTTHMIKVSGRFLFPAISRLLDRIPGDFDAVADARTSTILFKKYSDPYVTTQIILFKHAFYRAYLQDCYRELESGKIHHMERIYYEKLISLRDGHNVLLRFPCNVPPVGFPAHRKSSYSAPKEAIKNSIRAIARRVAPQWWI
jgi:hypothetical protein